MYINAFNKNEGSFVLFLFSAVLAAVYFVMFYKNVKY